MRLIVLALSLLLLFTFVQAKADSKDDTRRHGGGSGDTDLDDAPLGFGLVCGAGAATMLGAGIVFLPGCMEGLAGSDGFLAVCLSIAAGVMLYVSFVEIFVKSVDSFKEAGESENDAYLYGTISLFGGILINMFLGWVTDIIGGDEDIGSSDSASNTASSPGSGAGSGADVESPSTQMADIREKAASESRTENFLNSAPGAVKGQAPFLTTEAQGHGHSHGMDAMVEAYKPGHEGKLMKMGLKTALAIGLHNFPEGLATFVATLDDPSVGVSLAIAIAIHNIPEGICVAMPVYKATGSMAKGFFWAFLSGISEPIGAGIGWIVLYNTMDDYVYGALFGCVGGMMVHISTKELIPMALQYDKECTLVPNAMSFGFFIMAVSLVLFKY